MRRSIYPVLILLVASLAALCGCSGARARAGSPEPEFFRLPLVSPDAATPDAKRGHVRKDHVEPTEHTGPSATPGYRMDFQVRWIGNGIPHSYTPSLTVFAGQRGSLSLINQVSFVQDFDVEIEVQQGVFIADPIIGILQSGIVLEALPRPVEGARDIVLCWALLMSEAEPPFRTKNVAIGVGEPVTIQFPSIQVSRAAGRTLVTPGEHTLLAEVPLGEGTIEVAVRVEPETMVGDPDTRFLLGPDAAIAEPENLIEDISARPPPASGGFLHVAVVPLRAALPKKTMHLDRASAGRLLEDLALEPVREFRIRAAPESGAQVSCLLTKSYLKDYDVETGQSVHVSDPIVGTVEAGLIAKVVEGENGPELEFKLTSLVGFGEFTTSLAGTGPLTIELPEVFETAGKIEINSAVNIIEIGRLESGEHLALVVRRED